MKDTDLLVAERFEEHRGRLKAVAYRMLGSLTEADDAVQETWLRLSRTDAGAIENLGGWLTTVTGRVCLDLLRSRTARREQPMDEGREGYEGYGGYGGYDTFVPDPVISPLPVTDPEEEVLQADAVGLALLVVLETLEPAERLAFVLHDMFAVPFDDIAPIVEGGSAATRQLASRARRRVQGASTSAEPDPARRREVVSAFLAAARAGDFEALLAVLHPDVVLRADAGALVRGAAASKVVRGAKTVAEQAVLFRQFAPHGRLALVGDAVGILNGPEGELRSVMGVTVVDGRIVALHILADPERVAALDVPEGA